MAEKKLALRVLTPLGSVLEKQVDSVVLRTTEGERGFLPGHAPCVTLLALGMLRAYEDGQVSDSLFVMGGTACMENGTLTLLTEMAGGQQEVEAALQKLEEDLEKRQAEELRSSLEIQRAEAALRNALVQLDISSYSILHPDGAGSNE